jgi:hypothetical protein
MTPQMIKLLTLASTTLGAPCMNFDAWKEASNKGWIKSAGYKQNSTTQRFAITAEGAKALEAV